MNLFIIIIIINNMCYYIFLKKAPGQGPIQTNEVQNPYTLSQKIWLEQQPKHYNDNN
jgi:hypothetical protein